MSQITPDSGEPSTLKDTQVDGIRVSLFPSIRCSKSRNPLLEAILDGIKGRPPINDLWKNKIDPIRETYANVLAKTGDADEAKKAVKKPKENLAAFTPGGGCSREATRPRI